MDLNACTSSDPGQQKTSGSDEYCLGVDEILCASSNPGQMKLQRVLRRYKVPHKDEPNDLSLILDSGRPLILIQIHY